MVFFKGYRGCWRGEEYDVMGVLNCLERWYRQNQSSKPFVSTENGMQCVFHDMLGTSVPESIDKHYGQVKTHLLERGMS